MTCRFTVLLSGVNRTLAFTLLALATGAYAADRSWTGDAGDGRWGSANNWNPTGAPQDGDSLSFFVGASTVNNLTGLRLNSIRCDSSVAISGSRLILSNGIVAIQNCRLFVNCPITLGRNQEFRTATGLGADMTLTGNLDLNGFDLTLMLLTRISSLVLSNVISGAGNIRVERGPDFEFGSVALGAPGLFSTFAGTVTLQSGNLRLRGDEPLGTGGIILNNGLLTLVDATTARPLIVGSGFSVIGEGVCRWNGPISLPTTHETGIDPFLYVSSSNRFVLSGPIDGPTNASLICFGREVELAGSAVDTFAGGLSASCDLLLLNKSGGTHIGARRLGVGGNSEVRWLANNQLAGAALAVGGTAFVNLNGFSDSVASIDSSGGTIRTSIGELTLNGPIRQKGTPFAVMPLFIRGHLRLASGFHEFEVPDSHCCTNNVVIEAAIHGPGSFFKTGAGTLELNGANDYTGLTVINDGLVSARSTAALGTTDSSTIVNDGTLFLDFVAGTVNEQLSLRGAGLGSTNGALRLSGNIEIRNLFPAIFPAMELVSNATIRVDSGQLAITGEIRGQGSLTKIGLGDLLFAGSQPNTYTGETRIEQGALFLNKPTGTNAVPGHLIIGGGGGLFGASAIVRHFAGFTIIGSVIVDRGGLWDLNGFSEGFTVSALEGRPPLTLKVGGDVQTGAGKLFLPVGGDVVVTPGTFPGASSFISGNLGLDPGPHRFIVQSGVNIIGFDVTELDVSAVVSQTSSAADIVKESFGEMRLSSSNSFTGLVTVDGGTLIAANDFALGTTAVGTVVNGNAALALEGGLTVGFEPLTLNTTNRGGFTSLGAVTNVWRGNITLQQTAGFNVPESGGVLRLESFFGCCPSFITGPGGLTKSGAGQVLITGTVANNYTGLTTVNEGVLEASRTQGPALSGNVVVTGPSSVLRTGRNVATRVLAAAASVAVQDGALWTMNPANTETLIRLVGDGSLDIGSGGLLTISNSVSCTFSGIVSGSGALHKRGPATFQVTSPYSYNYAGAATVFDGTYKVDGDYRNSPVTVKPATILRGSGGLSNVTVEAGGIVKVDKKWTGLAGGALGMSSVNFQPSGGVLSLDFFGPSPTGGNDYLYVTGPVTLGNPNLSAGFLYPPREGDVVTLIEKVPSGAVSGIFSDFPEGALRMIGQIPVVASYVGGDGNDVTLTVTNLPLGGGGAQFVGGTGASGLIPDDCGQLWFVVTNRSATTLSNLHGTLRSLTEGVLVTRAESDFPNLAPNARGSNGTPFQIRTEPTFPCGGGAQLELVLTASNFPPTAVLYTIPAASGFGLSFDGRDDARVDAAANAFAGMVNNFTIELWANPTANRTQTAETNSGISGVNVAQRQIQRFAVFPDRGDLAYGSTHAGAGLSIGRNGISVYEQGTNRLQGGLILPSRLVYSNAVSGWTHVALVYASRQPQLYVNGALARSGSASIFANVHPSASLGGSVQADYGNFEGQLDEVRIWNVARSQTQIQTNMSRSLAGNESGLVVYYRCDEGGGTTLTDSASAIPSITGTIANGATFVFPGVTPFGDCPPGGGSCESCFVVSGQFTTNTPTLPTPLSPDGSPSLCFPPKLCPGPFPLPLPPTPFIQHTFTNTSGTQACVTAQLRFDCPAAPQGAMHAAVYLGAVDPNNPCLNYLGDGGGDGTVPFSFPVPAGSNVVILVTLWTPAIGCDAYTLELFGLPCPPPRLDIAKDTAPDKVLLQWSSAYPDYRLQSVNSLESSINFSNVSSPPVLVTGKFAVTNSATAPREFFRLTK